MIPRWLGRLERLCLNDDDREFLGGDLEERYWEDARSGRPGFAALRYALALLRVLPRRASGRLGRFTADLALGVRTLRRRPVFAATAILTLALGIGATTAIFTVANAVLLTPLPYPEPSRVLFVSTGFPGSTTGGDQLSWKDVEEIARRSRTIEAIAPYDTGAALELRGRAGEPPERVRVNIVGPEYLRILGARAMRGRLLGAEDNRTPGGHPVAVVSYDFWQRRLGGSDAALGSTLTLSDVPLTVVGILERGFTDVSAEEGFAFASDVFLPVMMAPVFSGRSVLVDPAARNFWALARVRDAATVEQARGEVSAIGRDLARELSANRGFTFWAEPLLEHLARNIRGPIVLLLAGSLFVLLIGCANVANLMLSHLSGRQRELAIRLSIGARPSHVASLLFAEVLVLCAAGGALGLFVASAGADAFRALVPGELTPRLGAAHLNVPALLCAAAVTVSTAIVLGGLAAARARGWRIGNALAFGSRGVTDGGGGRLRRGLLVAEVAIALLLVTAAALMIGSLARLRAAGVGFRTERLVTLNVDLRSARYAEPAAVARFGAAVVDALSAAPGVESAFLWGPARPGRNTWITFPGREDTPVTAERLMTWRHTITPGALEAIGIPLLRGREFTSHDTADTPAVAVISDTLARTLWPGQDPIGKRLKWRADQPTSPLLQVVGVAADANHRGRVESLLYPARDVYVPQAQRADRSLVAVVRAAGDPAGVVPAIRKAIARVDPDLPLFGVTTMREHMAEEEAETRFAAALMTAYGSVALLLAALGVYGVLSYHVAMRRREMAVRMALGASRAQVVAMIVGDGLRSTAAGVGVGLGAAVLAARYLESLLFQVSAHDPRTLAGVAALLLAVAAAAAALPARRATSVAPAEALRGDG